jgi:DNA-binding NarL/FixJ family response regulator
MPESTRIGLLDADEDTRFGRKQIFASRPNIELVFDSDGASSDLVRIQESLIDVLVIDQKLASGAGIDFYSRLRKLTGVKQVPTSILTASFDQPALLLGALEIGISDVVTIEQGAKTLIDAVIQARSNANSHTLAELHRLLAAQPRVRVVDLNFASVIDQLPGKLASNLRRLKSIWQKADMTKLESYDLNSLKEMVNRLPVATASELVLALSKSGLFDE